MDGLRVIAEQEVIDIFVPGRLCILGEHSDWAVEYGVNDRDIPNGYTLVCATNEGLYARCSRRNDSLISFIRPPEASEQRNHRSETKCNFTVPFTEESLLPIAQEGGFWSYVAGAAVIMLRTFSEQLQSLQSDSLRGVHIDNYRTTLPLQKGLSSSAAVCVLTVQAIAKLCLHNRQLTVTEVMALAYAGEALTPSGCGRMDQCVAMGGGHIALMTFPKPNCVTSNVNKLIDDGGVTLETLHNSQNLFFVVCDLGGQKDTVVILRDLRRALEAPSEIHIRSNNSVDTVQNSRDLFVQYLKDVARLSSAAKEALTQPNSSAVSLSLGQCMSEAQISFDTHCAPLCPTQLTSPRLHTLMNYLRPFLPDDSEYPVCTPDAEVVGHNTQSNVHEIRRGDVLAVKGVGSQGDGSAQILCRDLEAQQRLLRHLRHSGTHLVTHCFPLTVPAVNVADCVTGNNTETAAKIETDSEEEGMFVSEDF